MKNEVSLKVDFLDFPPSDAVYNAIYDDVEKLQHVNSKIISCHVTVASPHRHSHKGRIYHIGIKLHLSGKDIFITREPEKKIEHEDIYVAIRDAFHAAERKLESYRGKQIEHKNFEPSQSGTNENDEM